jgi:hypothetical protein
MCNTYCLQRYIGDNICVTQYCLHIITWLVIKILIRFVVKIIVSPTFIWARLIYKGRIVTADIGDYHALCLCDCVTSHLNE